MDKRAGKNYRKYTRALLAVSAGALLICAGALGFQRGNAVRTQGIPEQSYASYYSPKPAASQETGKTGGPSQAAPSSAASGEKYLITVYNGKIGVFRKGEITPFLTADVDVYLLPEEDVALLKKGIRVEGFSAVKSVLEDYE